MQVQERVKALNREGTHYIAMTTDAFCSIFNVSLGHRISNLLRFRVFKVMLLDFDHFDFFSQMGFQWKH